MIMNQVLRDIWRIFLGLLLAFSIGTTAANAQSKKKEIKEEVAPPTENPQSNKQRQQFDARQYVEILGSALKELQMYYVDSIDYPKILTAGIDAMLAELDPYTEFFNEEDQKDFRTMTTGEYGGIGAIIMQRGDTVYIRDPYESQPAAEAGLRPGDAILSINDEDMIKKPTDVVSEKLRGQPNTNFELRILRPTEKEAHTFKITRRKITLPAVPFYGWINDSIAYIALESFTDKAAQEVQEALFSLRQAGTMKGLVFDLRDNGGGLLDEAVKILGFFLPKGSTVVETKAKLPQWNSTYKTPAEPLDSITRIAVLINRGSASAAEIVSGALQDMDRAVIMGERSFGKGLVQSTHPLPYNTLLKFTSAKYYIPSGRCIQAIDYSHRNEDGSVGRIPDSLTQVFHTHAGREVRDGGGIKPDVEQKPQKLSTLAYYLQFGNHIFDYANLYRMRHDSIGDAETFSITDADYADFCEKVKSQNFTYARISNKKLKELRETAQVEGYADVTQSELDSLEAKLGKNLDGELQTFRNEIKSLINQEIAMRYYYQRGGRQQMLLIDSLSIQAAALLADAPRYNRMLSPTPEQQLAATREAEGHRQADVSSKRNKKKKSER